MTEFDEHAFDIAQLLDALEAMVAYSRVATFDEVDGEREVFNHATAVIAQYKKLP